MFKYKVLSGIHYVNGKMNRVGDVVVLAKKIEELWPGSVAFFDFVGEFTPEVAETSETVDVVDKTPDKPDGDVFAGLIFPEEKIVDDATDANDVSDEASEPDEKPVEKPDKKPVKRRGRRKTAVVGDATP